MKVLIFAYHNIGYTCVKELLSLGAEISAVITHKDSKGENIWFKSVEDLARKNKIPVSTPTNKEIRSENFFRKIKKINPDIIFSFYYRYLLPESILEIPRLGAFNLHGSYLPAYRGRCPVNWAIIKGEKSTGVTLHYMEKSPDSGDIVAQKRVPISFRDTAFTLFTKMEKASGILIRKTYPLIEKMKIKPHRQNFKKASYFGGRNPEDGLIHWENSAESIYNLIRAVAHPYPGAYTFIEGKKLFVWNAVLSKSRNTLKNIKQGIIIRVFPSTGMLIKTGKGLLLVKSVQLEGEKEIKGKDLFRKFKGLEGILFK